MKKKLIAIAIATAVFAPITAQAMFSQDDSLAKPTNHYDVAAWDNYWKQNPNRHRGVGAEGDNDPTAEEFAELQTQLKTATEGLATATASIETLTVDNEKWKSKQSEAEKHRKEEEKKAQEALDAANRKSGNVEAIEASWTEKYDALKADNQTTIDKHLSTIQRITVGATATAMSADLALSGSADVLKPHIESRLAIEWVDGEPHTRVLKDGKPSAMTLEELAAEIGEMKSFAPILKGTDASGGGPLKEGDTDGKGKEIKRATFDAMNPAQRSAHISKGGKVVD